jgi:hypothetical protein
MHRGQGRILPPANAPRSDSVKLMNRSSTLSAITENNLGKVKRNWRSSKASGGRGADENPPGAHPAVVAPHALRKQRKAMNAHRGYRISRVVPSAISHNHAFST